MKMRFILAIQILALGMLSCNTVKENGALNYMNPFESLDDGVVLLGDGLWKFENEVLTGSGDEATYVITEGEYANFILDLDFYPVDEVNSGIFVRCPGNEIGATSCYEINIWDNHVNQDFRTGAIVTHGKPLATVMTLNQWNHYKIDVRDNQIKAYINGTLTADLTDNKTSKGTIALQAMKGTVRFRNIKLRVLP